MAHVLAYLRVSKQEQAESGAGLAAQRASILREAERRGWAEADLDWITDAGFTGRSLRRPGVTAALAMLKAHKADTLVVAKADRLSRSMEDFTRIMADATRERWALVALDMNLDMTTAEGELQAHMLASFAAFERRRIADRTREGLAAKRAAGVVLGRPRTLSQDIVDRIVRERRAGATMTAIADGLNDDGVPTARGGVRWYQSTVRRVLGYADG